MFEGLDAIDWAALRHAYGEASDVPATLRRLVSDDESVRQEALSDLCGTIWHQGTVYEATVPAIPFLYSLLTIDGPHDKPGIVALLTVIADGRGYYQVHAKEERDSSVLAAVLARRDTTLEEELKREANYVERIRAAICEGLSLLLPYLRDPSEEIRRFVAIALAEYPERREQSLPALRAAVEVEQDADALAEMEKAIEKLAVSAS
jgi:hypothetical protein